MIEIEELWAEIDCHAAALQEEMVALSEACGRVLGKTVYSRVDTPPFDQSAVDGYAIAGTGPFSLVGHQAAGRSGGGYLNPGETVRVLTGALIPNGAQSVVKQEECIVTGDSVQTPDSVPEGTHIRRRGAVLKLGQEVIAKGALVTPGVIGLLAASGSNGVQVVRQPQVLHLVTGDEIVPPGAALKPGQIHDSNGPMIAALLQQRGIPPNHLRQIRLGDSSNEIGAAVDAFEGDLLLISGGSGPGDRDHTLGVLQKAGYTIHASRLNSRPGKPLIFASRSDQIAFGLPGNPLSHFVCYHGFVRRALDRLEGRNPVTLSTAQLVEDIQDEGDGRRSWIPCRLEGGTARRLAWKHSGDLTALAYANALILLEGGHSLTAAGSPVRVLCLP